MESYTPLSSDTFLIPSFFVQHMKRSAIPFIVLLVLMVGCSPPKEMMGNDPRLSPCNPFPSTLPALSQVDKEKLIDAAVQVLSDKPNNVLSTFDAIDFPVLVVFRQAGKVAGS